jgi:crossover junction endodeoxyribonuclease RuvC
MYILGIDPGFSSLGWAVCSSSSDGVLAHYCGVIRTEKSNKKIQLRASEDNINRAQTIYLELDETIKEHEIDLVCTESMSWPRNAGVVAKMGIVWGVIASVCYASRLPMLQVSPVEIKKSLTGSKQASKEEMIAKIVELYPKLAIPSQQTLQEHAADAVAAVLACRNSMLFKAMEDRDAN